MGGDGEDPGIGSYVTTRFPEESGIGIGDFVVVDYGGLRGVDGLDPVGVGLDFPELLGAYDTWRPLTPLAVPRR